MGISIQDKSVEFSDNFPILGNIVRNDVLKWGMRPVTALSSVNLAEDISGVLPLNNPSLRGDIGFFKNSTYGGSFQATQMSTKDLKKTIFTTVSLPAALDVGQIWIAGSFTFQDRPDFPSGFSIAFNMKADGLYMWAIANTIETDTTQKALAFAEHKLSRNTGTFCLAATIDHVLGVITAFELNANTSTVKNASLDYTKYTGTDVNVYPFKFGSSYDQPDVILRGVNFHECFYFKDVLATTDLQQQKEYSKVILGAKGIDVSVWL